ncbi:hypothetical protein D3C77_599440 [compost metagenome]
MLFECQLQQVAVVAAYQNQIRPTVDFFTGMVTGQLLGAVVTAQDAGHQDLADTEGLHLGQVLFQGQAPEGQRFLVLAGKRLFDFFHGCDHNLTPSCRGPHRFYPQWPVM